MRWVKEIEVCYVFCVAHKIAVIFIQDAWKGLYLSVIPSSLVNLIVWKTKLRPKVTAFNFNPDKVKVLLPKRASYLEAIKSDWAQKFFRWMSQYS